MVEKKANVKSVSWEAEEYVRKERGAAWYVGAGMVVICSIVLFVLLKWWTSLVVVILSEVAIILYSVKPPRMVKYSLSSKGLTEGEKVYELENYRSFGIAFEGEHCAIVLCPRKRFGTKLMVYFPKEDGEKIVDFLGARMPMEEVKLDFIDKIVAILRI